MGTAFLTKFATAMQQNETISHLEFRGAGMGFDVAKQILKAVAVSVSVRSVFLWFRLDHESNDPEVIYKLAVFVATKNPNLTSCDVYLNQATGMWSIARAGDLSGIHKHRERLAEILKRNEENQIGYWLEN